MIVGTGEGHIEVIFILYWSAGNCLFGLRFDTMKDALLVGLYSPFLRSSLHVKWKYIMISYYKPHLNIFTACLNI